MAHGSRAARSKHGEPRGLRIGLPEPRRLHQNASRNRPFFLHDAKLDVVCTEMNANRWGIVWVDGKLWHNPCSSCTSCVAAHRSCAAPMGATWGVGPRLAGRQRRRILVPHAGHVPRYAGALGAAYRIRRVSSSPRLALPPSRRQSLFPSASRHFAVRPDKQATRTSRMRAHSLARPIRKGAAIR